MKTLTITLMVGLLFVLAVTSYGSVIRTENFDSNPGWTGQNTNVDSTLNYGYSAATSNAGGVAGEYGGELRRSGGVTSYAGDNLGGNLTLNEAFELNWSSNNGAKIWMRPNGVGWDGYHDDMFLLGFYGHSNMGAWTPGAFMGLLLSDDGLYVFASAGSSYLLQALQIPRGNEEATQVRFKYDPNEGAYGTITGRYGSNSSVTAIALTQAIRNSGIQLDTFGLAAPTLSSSTGWNTVYIDELSYTAVTAVPEPGSIMALGFGLVSLVGAVARRKR